MDGREMNRRPLKIGLSPRFLHSVPREMGFKGKTLQYMEQSIAHWLMSAGALVFMIPSIAGGGEVRVPAKSAGDSERSRPPVQIEAGQEFQRR